MNEISPYTLTGDLDGRWPLVMASPHSGREYPPSFLASAALGLSQLRRAEDALVDQLLAGISGVPVLCARYGRAYLDLNRAPEDLDPAMFEGPLAVPTKRSERVDAGLGVIPRMAGPGLSIYKQRQPAAHASARLAALHHPWHNRLTALLEAARARHGYAILIDCHSMPRPAGLLPPQIVLGDRHGRSASPALVDIIEQHFSATGWRVARNNPYAGGHITERHGQPWQGIHAVQIEVDRGLYLDSSMLQPGPGFAAMAQQFRSLAQRLLAALPLVDMLPRQAAE